MSEVVSPCVRNCCLDDDDVCMGCYRTLEEIKVWASLNDNQKNNVLILCRKRKQERPDKI